MLYIVLFLHQTTTYSALPLDGFKLYIVLFLHQTTTYVRECNPNERCISYYSYIKPQLLSLHLLLCHVVYRTIPTSNHNVHDDWKSQFMLYIVLFLHQTTTASGNAPLPRCCISYYSYIKPQLGDCATTTTDSCISYYSYIKPQPIMLI